ncbi:MAG TPA: cell division protein FtsL [Candidatus Acidoferrum sp.]|jgi:cell division protein FtsL|nr:cell division protein FtsL [Candidatus Acidoferrum sp.]
MKDLPTQFVTEYFTVKQIDNSRLARPAAPARVQDFWRRVAVGAAMAGCLLSYAWQHFECIQIRYRIEQLDSERAKAEELNQQLHLEVATLRSPSRVDAIARNQLGLTVPVPGQVAPVDDANDGVVAQARTLALPSRP